MIYKTYLKTYIVSSNTLCLPHTIEFLIKYLCGCYFLLYCSEWGVGCYRYWQILDGCILDGTVQDALKELFICTANVTKLC